MTLAYNQIIGTWRKDHEGGTLTVPHFWPQGQGMDLLWLAFPVLLFSCLHSVIKVCSFLSVAE